MNKKNLFIANKKNVNEFYFDGKVNIKEIYGEMDSSDNEIYYVEFFDGALTTLHYHETEQTLIPFYGKGVIGEIEKLRFDSPPPFKFDVDDIKIKFLEVGDIVIIPKNILHFHGALPYQTFSHIAFRKIFQALCANNQITNKQTQTKWLYDLISLNHPNSIERPDILNQMLEISSIIKKAIENHIVKK